MVMGSLAFKTALMQSPFYTKDMPFLAPHERRSFSDLAQSWAGMIQQNISDRLGGEPEPEPAPLQPDDTPKEAA
jgi:hypothetical protein